MKPMEAAVFCADVDRALDEIVATREEIVITRGGVAIARLLPVADVMRGPMYGTVTFVGDIITPLEKWDCECEDDDETVWQWWRETEEERKE